MPIDSLPVPLFEQALDGACLPACARMVLAYLGLAFTEAQLAQVLGMQAAGTPAYHIQRLENLGVAVTFGQISEARLRAYLLEQIPVIAFVQAGELSYWPHDSFHAVVVIGLADEVVVINDPAFHEPQTASLNELMLAWSEFDYTYALIERA